MAVASAATELRALPEAFDSKTTAAITPARNTDGEGRTRSRKITRKIEVRISLGMIFGTTPRKR